MRKKSVRNAGPMKFAMEFSEAVCEIEETAAELSEDGLKARLQGVNVGYRTRSVTDEHGGLCHRVVAGLERESRKRHKPTDEEVYEDLNWHIYER